MRNALAVLEAAVLQYGAVTIQATKQGMRATYHRGFPRDDDLEQRHAHSLEKLMELLALDAGVVTEQA